MTAARFELFMTLDYFLMQENMSQSQQRKEHFELNFARTLDTNVLGRGAA